MGNDQMNRSLDQKIKRFESNVEKTIASAFKLQKQLGGTEDPNLWPGQMQRMAVSAYHASGNLLAIMFLPFIKILIVPLKINLLQPKKV